MTIKKRKRRFDPLSHHKRRIAWVAASLTVLAALPSAAQRQSSETRSPADVPPMGTYLHLLGTASVGNSIRFNNPFRLEHQLGDSGESLSLTPPYANLGGGFAFGDADGVQHGGALQWSWALSGLRQHVVTPGYLLMLGGWRPWLVFGRAGLPVVMNPDPNLGGELAVGGAYLLTAGLGLQAEFIGNVFYGAATWEKKITTIPMLSLHAGVIVDYEVLP